MTIGRPKVLEVSGSGTDQLAYSTGTVAPSPNTLLLLFVSNGFVSAVDDVPPVPTGLGLTWNSIPWGAVLTAGTQRGSWFWAKTGPTSPPGQITFTFSKTMSSCQWHVIEVPHADLANPYIQGSNYVPSPTEDDPASYLNNTLQPGSALFAAMLANAVVGQKVKPGGVLLSTSPGHSGPAVMSQVGYRVDGNNMFQWELTADWQKAICAIEIAASPTPRYITLENGVRLLTQTGQQVAENNMPPTPSPIFVKSVLAQTLDASSTSITGTFLGAVPAGNTIIVVLNGVGTSLVTAVTDTKGNRWQVDQNSASNIGQTILRCHVDNPLTATDTLTVTRAAAATGQILMGAEFSGLPQNAKDQHAAADGGGTTFSSGLMATTAQDVELLIGTLGQTAAQPVAGPTPGFITMNQLSSASRYQLMMYKIVSVKGQYSFDAHAGQFQGATNRITCSAYKAYSPPIL